MADFKSAIEQAEFEDSAADVKSLRIELKKAEAALKRSKTKDYYKILGMCILMPTSIPNMLSVGIARDCNESEIKKGYRRESLIHHPDKGGDEEKFKLVVEAHSVLSDPQRRQRYDMGEDEDGSDANMGGGMGGMNPMDMAELFAQFGGGAGGGVPRGFGGGGGGRSGGGFHSHSSFGGGGGQFGF